MRRLLEWERDAIVDAMASGEKRDAICAEFGVTRSYPSMLARRRGIEPRKRVPSLGSQLEKPVVTT